MAEAEKTPEIQEAAAVKEPHLLDFNDVYEVAQWIVILILGLTRDVVYDLTKGAVIDVLGSIRRRFGKTRIQELEQKVEELIAELKSRSNLSEDEVSARVKEIFKDYR